MTLSRRTVDDLVRGTILAGIGHTPLVRLSRIDAGLPGEVWAKLESANPGGSVKDRPGLWMILAAEESGQLRPGLTILDATSGNTGIALALVGAVRRHPVELVMPDRVSLERKKIARALGATLTLTSPLDGTDGAIVEARRRAAAEPGRYLYLDQYSNSAIRSRTVRRPGRRSGRRPVEGSRTSSRVSGPPGPWAACPRPWSRRSWCWRT